MVELRHSGASLRYQRGSFGLSRDLNRAAILRLIGAHGPIARTHIARQLGLSPATVTAVTRELVEQGLVRVAERATSRRGRPLLLLELVATAATAFGIKIAPDHLVGVRVNLCADVLERFEEPFDARSPHVWDELGAILESWIGDTAAYPPLVGVGLGVSGVFNGRTGTLDSPLLGWDSVPLAQLMQERLGVPTFVDNDVNTLTVFERLYGRGQDVDDFLTVVIGRGVGLGIVVNGDVYRGYCGGAGEFGHSIVVEKGPRCSCGRRGCLEAFVAKPSLVAQARRQRLLTRQQGFERLLELADAGDARASAIFAAAGSKLGVSVANVTNVLNPQLILISGEETVAWPHLAPEFERAFRATIFSPVGDVSIEVDPWDDVTWAVGAATLALATTFTSSAERDDRRAMAGDVAALAPVRGNGASHVDQASVAR